MAEVHGVVRTDQMAGTDNRAYMRSVRYVNSSSELVDIDNGCVVAVGGLYNAAEDREVRVANDMATDTDFYSLGLIASPEVMYDSRLRDLEDFYNIGDAEYPPQRVYLFRPKDIFSVTPMCLGSSNVNVGRYVNKAAGNKLTTSNSITAGETVGRIIADETDSSVFLEGRRYIVIELDIYE